MNEFHEETNETMQPIDSNGDVQPPIYGDLYIAGIVSTKDRVLKVVEEKHRSNLQSICSDLAEGEWTFADFPPPNYDIVILGGYDNTKYLSIHTSSKPDGWSWAKFVEIVKITKMIPFQGGKAPKLIDLGQP